MNILFISRLYLPHLGGVEIHLRELSALLVKEGHTVTILTRKHDNRLADSTEYDGVQVVRIPLESAGSKVKTWSAIQKHTKLFSQADIIHVHDVFWWVLPQYFQIRKKLYMTFHGWETKYPIPKNNKIHRWLAAKLVQKSIHVGAYIQKLYWDTPDTVIYGGINPKRFTKSTILETKTDTHQYRFTFVGRLEQDTAVPEYCKLFSLLQKKKISFSVTWVGDGSLAAECKKFGMVTGFVKNISKYIVPADFVCASSYLAILEAQLLGKVVCGMYNTPVKKLYLEVFPGAKHMLISDTPKGMLKKLTHLFSSSKRKNKIEIEAQAYARSQTWDQVVVQYKQLWNLK